MSGRIVQIVPHLPQPPEGVGSFAVALADALRTRCGIESNFLVASPSSAPGRNERESSALKIAGANKEAFSDAIEIATSRADTVTVLLHYSNYGYAPRGCPSWLIDGLTEWKTKNRGRLVTVFHEIHASGPPWRSSFWLSPLQRRLAASLARLSEGLTTSMRLYQRILLRWAPEKEVTALPVFSTVGEPIECPPLAGRARRIVVFGGPGTRARAYRELRSAMESACRALEIEEVYDIGPGDGLPAPDLSVTVRRLGPLPEAQVSEILTSSLAGFLAYPAPFLPKSTIFAAYCAHRLLPICAWPWPRREVEPLPPFWFPQPDTLVRSDHLQTIADRARAWYAGHALNHHAESYQNLLYP
jgi:hypothetical protein